MMWTRVVVIGLTLSTPLKLKRSLVWRRWSVRALGADFFSFFQATRRRARCDLCCLLCWTLWLLDLISVSVQWHQGFPPVPFYKEMPVSLPDAHLCLMRVSKVSEICTRWEKWEIAGLGYWALLNWLFSMSLRVGARFQLPNIAIWWVDYSRSRGTHELILGLLFISFFSLEYATPLHLQQFLKQWALFVH